MRAARPQDGDGPGRRPPSVRVEHGVTARNRLPRKKTAALVRGNELLEWFRMRFFGPCSRSPAAVIPDVPPVEAIRSEQSPSACPCPAPSRCAGSARNEVPSLREPPCPVPQYAPFWPVPPALGTQGARFRFLGPGWPHPAPSVPKKRWTATLSIASARGRAPSFEGLPRG